MKAVLRNTAGKTAAEFFAGIGLMRLGIERAGWSVAFANDIDPKKEEIYRANFADAHDRFVLGDIGRLAPSAVPTVALATASFPCNDLSLAGARGGLDGKNSSAFWPFARLLREMNSRRPPILLIENVLGFLTSRGGADLASALEALNRLGYAVDVLAVNAAWFVPQSRERLFIVGSLARGTRRASSHATIVPHALRPAALADFIARHPNIQWAIRELPAPAVRRARLTDLLEDLPADAPEWWSAERAARLVNQMSPKHRAVADGMIAGASPSFGAIFRRTRAGRPKAELRTDGLAGCLRTPRGGSGRQILFAAGGGSYRVRLFTPRECARLMGADDFNLPMRANQALFGFGDAVCVPAIEWIARKYLNPLFDDSKSAPCTRRRSASRRSLAASQ